MKLLTTDEARKQAATIAKTVTSMGSPFGPVEAAYYGILHAAKLYENKLAELEAEIAQLKRERK
jgi:hypothetical protein